jgi:hypothetical protein
MSTITTLSAFTYGHTVTLDNRSVDFSEGGPEIQGNLEVGNYSLEEYAAEWERMLNTFGTFTYTVSVDRSTGKLQFTASSSVTFLAGTGTRIGTGAWEMAGFDPSDQLGTSFQSDNRSGKLYRPQYLLDNYTSPDHYKVKESAAVNISASGQVQVLSFGDGSRMKCNIKAITNKTGLKIDPWYENASGISDALDFLEYIITKGKVEFMPDIDTPNTFFKLLLDSTKEDRSGVAFELKNMKTPDVYESGDLTFREVLT